MVTLRTGVTETGVGRAAGGKQQKSLAKELKRVGGHERGGEQWRRGGKGRKKVCGEEICQVKRHFSKLFHPVSLKKKGDSGATNKKPEKKKRQFQQETTRGGAEDSLFIIYYYSAKLICLPYLIKKLEGFPRRPQANLASGASGRRPPLEIIKPLDL